MSWFSRNSEYEGCDIPNDDMVPLPEDLLMRTYSRREFLRVMLLGVAAPLLMGAKIREKFIEVTITSKEPTNSFSGAVDSVCDKSVIQRYYGVKSYLEALNKLGEYNGIKNIGVVRPGQNIKIPIVLLKRRARSYVTKKRDKIKVESSRTVEAASKGFQKQNQYGFQSPFGSNILPKLHRCTQRTVQNRSHRNGFHITCPFDKWGAGRGFTKPRRHKGHDFYCEIGTPLYPIKPGRVIRTGFRRGNGNHVKIQSGTFVYQLLHMSRIDVKTGDEVGYGTRLGLSGISENPYKKKNPHVHVHLSYRGRLVNPVEKYLRFMIAD